MNLFVPSTDLELSEAVVQAAQWWFPERLAEATLTAEETDQLGQHRAAVFQIINRSQPLSGSGLFHAVPEGSAFRSLAALASPQPPSEPFPRSDFEEVMRLAEETESVRSLQEREKARKKLLDETWSRLRQLLYKGELPGFIYIYLTGETIEAPAHIWGAITLNNAHVSATVRLNLDGREIIGRGRVRRDELELVLDGKPARSKAEQAGEAAPGEAGRAKGGRPTKASRDEVWLHICRTIYEGNHGASLTEFKANVLLHCQHKVKDPPDSESIGRLVGKVWRELKLDPKG